MRWRTKFERADLWAFYIVSLGWTCSYFTGGLGVVQALYICATHNDADWWASNWQQLYVVEENGWRLTATLDARPKARVGRVPCQILFRVGVSCVAIHLEAAIVHRVQGPYLVIARSTTAAAAEKAWIEVLERDSALSPRLFRWRHS